MKIGNIGKWFYTPGERAIMGRIENLEAQGVAVEELLTTVDAQVEAMFKVIKDQADDISESAATRLTASLDRIRAAAEKIATNDEPTTEPGGNV